MALKADPQEELAPEDAIATLRWMQQSCEAVGDTETAAHCATEINMYLDQIPRT